MIAESRYQAEDALEVIDVEHSGKELQRIVRRLGKRGFEVRGEQLRGGERGLVRERRRLPVGGERHVEARWHRGKLEEVGEARLGLGIARQLKDEVYQAPPALVLTALVRNFWEFAAVYGVLVPLGLAGTGPVIASGVVARWFSRRRGTALSVLGLVRPPPGGGHRRRRCPRARSRRATRGARCGRSPSRRTRRRSSRA